jgi:hypothetical protein
MGILAREYFLPALYMVFIGPAKGIKPGMGISPDGNDPVDGDIPGQFVVDPEQEFQVICQSVAAVHMRIEDPGMDPGIRPSAAGHHYILSKQQAEIFVQDLLNCDGIGLDLPAVIIGTFEGEFYEIPGFQ